MYTVLHCYADPGNSIHVLALVSDVLDLERPSIPLFSPESQSVKCECYYERALANPSTA